MQKYFASEPLLVLSQPIGENSVAFLLRNALFSDFRAAFPVLNPDETVPSPLLPLPSKSSQMSLLHPHLI